MAHFFKIVLILIALQLAGVSALASTPKKSKTEQIKKAKKHPAKKVKKLSKKSVKKAAVHKKKQLKKKKKTTKAKIGQAPSKIEKINSLKKKKTTFKKSRKKLGALKAPKLKKLPKTRSIKRSKHSSHTKWYVWGLILVVLGSVGAFIYNNKTKSKMAFDFNESDINRSPKSKVRASLKTQPSSKIISSKAMEENQTRIQRFGKGHTSPLKNITCELNFNNPNEDHGQPKIMHRKSA